MDENKPADLKRREMRRRQGAGRAEAQVVQLFPQARVHAGADAAASLAPDLPETARKEKPTLRQRLLQAIFKAVDTDNW